MINPRTSGILLHPTSLPSRFGIGDLGDSACRFADFLSDTHQRLWQVLPLNPTGYGNSPYQGLSVFAGNPLLISPERLFEDGLLLESDLNETPDFPREYVNYEATGRFKMSLLEKSFDNFEKKGSEAQREAFGKFSEENADWLDTFALFMALKDAHGGESWGTWGDDIKKRRPEALAAWSLKLSREIQFYKYQQHLFFKQWANLKSYCNSLGIRLIGDIAIFVALDSAEVWSHPEMFYLDKDGRPTVVAGVPPDYFSKTGQLWGNPIYRWDEMARDGFRWWIQRFRAARALVDIIRLDHFRGFESYWEIPGGDTTAINGHWVPGPGADLFDAVRSALGPLPIIVEDLGVITPEVDALREKLGFPGMRVLQFAFGDDRKADFYKPHSYECDTVVYTATHDNDTTTGWFFSKDPTATTQSDEERREERKRALTYTGTDGKEISWDFIRLAQMSVANTAVYPMQDVLGLGSEARINRPGTTRGNWRWRFTPEMVTPRVKERLREMTYIYGRAYPI